MKIGDVVNYVGEYDEMKSGSIYGVMSDMDSYELMVPENGVPCYWSKKMGKYTPVKKKNIESVFLEIETKTGFDYILMNEVNELSI